MHRRCHDFSSIRPIVSKKLRFRGTLLTLPDIPPGDREALNMLQVEAVQATQPGLCNARCVCSECAAAFDS
jgi:hypothetical protein